MKKQHILLAVVLLIVGALSVLAIYKYEQQPKGITLTDAVHQRNLALTDLAIEKQLDAVHQTAAHNVANNLTAQVNSLTTQKATLCAQLKAARLVQPLCQ